MPKVTNEQKLEKAISYARKHPLEPKPRVAAYFEVSQVTLRRRVAGTQATRREANHDRQTFDHGEEEAIAEHCLMMADRGFPLTFELLHRIAQAIINDRAPPNNEYDIGRHWVRRFLDRHPTLDQRYIAYQE